MQTVLTILSYWDVILLGLGVAIAIAAVIAKHTRNTVDDEVVTAAGEILDVVRTIPSRARPVVPVAPPAPPPPPAPPAAPVKPSKATQRVEEVEDALAQVGKIVDVVDTLAPAITAPAKQASAVVGALAGLVKIFVK